FHRLLELPAGERAAALELACPEDAEMRRQVAAMLAADEGLGQGDAAEVAIVRTLERLEDLVEPGARRAAPDPEASGGLGGPRGPEPSELHFGPYRVLRTLGRGGMGTVYLAERADGQFRQRVAIKRIRAGLGDEHLSRRMRQERQILATLEHPGIARLIDGGVAADGHPYFVMEYVEGLPLDAYCDRRRLPVRARVELFLHVCAAVHHAHQNLILHRDLKPANVLVTDEGSPKLLDFGIAKLLDAESPVTRAETAVGLRLLTPQFASPEQVRGEVLGTASDVYSLGVVLHQLLTGELPAGSSDVEGEWRRAVDEIRVTRPSEVALREVEGQGPNATMDERAALRGERPERLARSLRGDLDTIVLTALRREPERRYASVEQLAEDLRRHLEQLPIRARPEGVGYRVGKFISRHRWLVATVSTLLVTLVAGIVATTWQARRADRALQEARRQQVRAEQALDLMLGIIAQANPTVAGGRELTVREVLDLYRKQMAGRFIDEPLDRAQLLDTLGRAYRSLGRLGEAEAALEEAVDLYRLSLEPGDPILGDGLEHLAELRYAQGRLEVAEALQTEALALRMRAFGELDVRVGESLNDLATLAGEQGDSALAIELFDRSFAALRASVGEQHPEFARALANRGVLAFQSGDPEQARRLLSEALGIRRQRLVDGDPATLSTATNLAAVLESMGRGDEAEVLMRESLRKQVDVLGEDHPLAIGSLNNLAALLARRGVADEAEKLYRLAVERHRAYAGPDYSAAVLSLRNLGDLLARQGRRPEAEANYREALERFRRIPSADRKVAATAVRLANLVATERPSEAEALYLEVLTMADVNDPSQGVDPVDLRFRLGRLTLAQERFAEAELWLGEGLELERERHGADSVEAAKIAVALARSLASRGLVDAAKQKLGEALPILRAAPGPEAPALLEARALARSISDADAQGSVGIKRAKPPVSPEVEPMARPAG
ncbi:MAG: serine/threonine-protein kinase, partial [Acidobacteriota bacterium]